MTLLRFFSFSPSPSKKNPSLKARAQSRYIEKSFLEEAFNEIKANKKQQAAELPRRCGELKMPKNKTSVKASVLVPLSFFVERGSMPTSKEDSFAAGSSTRDYGGTANASSLVDCINEHELRTVHKRKRTSRKSDGNYFPTSLQDWLLAFDPLST